MVKDEMYRLLVEAVPEGIWVVDADGRTVFSNTRMAEILGVSFDAMAAQSCFACVFPEELADAQRHFARAMAGDSSPFEFRLRRADDSPVWVRISCRPVRDNGVEIGLLGLFSDITEQKRAEARLRDAEAALSDFSGKLIDAQEQERAWIARELHDDICQRVAALALKLDGLGKDVPAPHAARLRALYDETEQLGNGIRTISHRLHSSALEHLGLSSAAASFCEELADAQHVEIRFTQSGLDGRVPSHIALSVFRVLQEALTNAIRHSGVRHFVVDLAGDDNGVQLEVKDGGKGFNPESAAGAGGLGLISMQERLRLVGGQVVIDSRPGRGTTVRARVPG